MRIQNPDCRNLQRHVNIFPIRAKKHQTSIFKHFLFTSNKPTVSSCITSQLSTKSTATGSFLLRSKVSCGFWGEQEKWEDLIVFLFNSVSYRKLCCSQRGKKKRRVHRKKSWNTDEKHKPSTGEDWFILLLSDWTAWCQYPDWIKKTVR